MFTIPLSPWQYIQLISSNFSGNGDIPNAENIPGWVGEGLGGEAGANAPYIGMLTQGDWDQIHNYLNGSAPDQPYGGKWKKENLCQIFND
jgi:hypothetical protein